MTDTPAPKADHPRIRYRLNNGWGMHCSGEEISAEVAGLLADRDSLSAEVEMLTAELASEQKAHDGEMAYMRKLCDEALDVAQRANTARAQAETALAEVGALLRDALSFIEMEAGDDELATRIRAALSPAPAGE